jgi:hypothetical protein
MSTTNPPAPWRKSSHSGEGDCVEWQVAGTHVAVRDSKNPDGPTLTFTHSEWRAFLAGVRDGEADLAPPRSA